MVHVEADCIVAYSISELAPGFKKGNWTISIMYVGEEGRMRIAIDWNPTPEAVALLQTMQNMHAQIADLTGEAWKATCIALQRHVLPRAETFGNLDIPKR